MATDYRRDIDGLRAVAVLPVVLFHAGVPGFGGGFVGVDVFFVISGYLITQVLMRDRGHSLRSALADFYLRRCRRILPALVAMLAIVAIIACVLLLPTDLRRFGIFLALASAYLGNLAAWLGGGYFDSSGASLVHLWSIGIEEQFYLVFPLPFLLAARRPTRASSFVLALLAVASFAMCAWGSYTHPAATFYGPVTRAWELLAGALLAHSGWRGFRDARLNEIAAVCAFVALAASVVLFDARMHYPGVPTALPCGATLLLLATPAQSETRIARLLSMRALVFTGLISYSLYLWHAPLLGLERYFAIFAPSPLQLGILLVLIYLVSMASWRWIETPFRSRTLLRSNSRFLAVFLGASAASCVAGAAVWASDGLPQRFASDIRQISDMSGLDKDADRCMAVPIDAIERGEVCMFDYGGSHARRMLVWGDSHAIALLPAFRDAARSQHMRLYMAAQSSCRPLIGMHSETSLPVAAEQRRQDVCAAFNAAMLGAVKQLDPDIVMLAGFWNLPDFLAPASPIATRAATRQFGHALDETLGRVAQPGRRVCAVLDVPDRKFVVPYALAMARRRGLSTDFLRLTRVAAIEQQRIVDTVFAERAREGRLELVDPKSVLCAGVDCELQTPNGSPLYNDANHLSAHGARLLVDPLAQCARAVP